LEGVREGVAEPLPLPLREALGVLEGLPLADGEREGAAVAEDSPALDVGLRVPQALAVRPREEEGGALAAPLALALPLALQLGCSTSPVLLQPLHEQGTGAVAAAAGQKWFTGHCWQLLAAQAALKLPGAQARHVVGSDAPTCAL
jgi:hypothetical protein